MWTGPARRAGRACARARRARAGHRSGPALPGSCTRSGSRSTGTASSTAPPALGSAPPPRSARGWRPPRPARGASGSPGRRPPGGAAPTRRSRRRSGRCSSATEERHRSRPTGARPRAARLAPRGRRRGRAGRLEAVGLGVADRHLARHAALATAQEHPPRGLAGGLPARRAGRSRARRPGRSRALRRASRWRGIGVAWWMPVSAEGGRPACGTTRSPVGCGRPYNDGPVPPSGGLLRVDGLALEARLVGERGIGRADLRLRAPARAR